jgi:hypothetical protein
VCKELKEPIFPHHYEYLSYWLSYKLRLYGEIFIEPNIDTN